MARRITRPTAQPTSLGAKEQPITVEKTGMKDFVHSTREVLMSHRFRLAMGIVFISITLMLLIAFVSFFFTGAADYSIIEQSMNRSDMRVEIQNALGLPGAVISRWLIDGTFGLVSLAALVAMALYSLRMVMHFPLKRLRLLFITLFTLVWGSVVLGFAQQMLGIGSFYRWGGAFGQIVSAWATSYVQWTGVSLILLAILIVFLIVVDKHFVEHCQLMGQWIAGLFKKPQPTEQPHVADSTDIQDDTETADNVIDIILDPLHDKEQLAEQVAEDIPLLDTDMGAVRANAYDMVINGVEVGGGSIRIYDSELQNKMFELLGFTPERAQQQFGWLLDAFKYGAPPHGGLAYGLDRWVSLFAGLDSIRDCIAFPKNNSGRDTMIDAPSVLEPAQLDELNILVDIKEK